MMPSALPPANLARITASATSQTRPIIPPTCRPARSFGSATRRARSCTSAVPRRVSSQAQRAEQIAEGRQAADKHERRRREHQAHVEVADEEHVSSEIRAAVPWHGVHRRRREASALSADPRRPRSHARRRARVLWETPTGPGAARRRGRGPRDGHRELAGATNGRRPELGGLQGLALAGSGQGSVVLVGVEIWHMRRATLQTGTSPRCVRGLTVETSLECLRRRALVYLVADFVTTL